MAIADVPVSPLSTTNRRGRFETLTDAIAADGLCFQFGKIGRHDLLAEVIIGGGLVNEKRAAVDWFEWFVVHALIIDQLNT